MGKFSEVNRTFEIPKPAIEKILIDLFRKEENIDDTYDVTVRFNVFTEYQDHSFDDRGSPALSGATFTVTKKPPLPRRV